MSKSPFIIICLILAAFWLIVPSQNQDVFGTKLMLYEKGPKKGTFPSIHGILERIFANRSVTVINRDFSMGWIGPF